MSHILHPNFLGFLLHLRLNLCVLKSPLGFVETLPLLEVSSVVVFTGGVLAAGGFGAGSGAASNLAVMFLADLRRGVTDGGFVTKLSALIQAELGSFFGRSLVHFLVTGLLSSSLFALSSCSYDTFKLTL